MSKEEPSTSQMLPLALGVGIVVASFVIYKLYFSRPNSSKVALLIGAHKHCTNHSAALLGGTAEKRTLT
ncbi:hypothetical protein YQE_07121, partial [Dendroctonus ponderosae]